ncbi:hypothetical protein [Rothia aerolata]|uniref:Uncharacterized protein n=1 Tax=Rothia aerolata TaxID=1812262 RepID=A0A917MXL5_9MICC|nr:hypothetical protein [Rothia aerolata]GGH66949.1 hypothetical protein GCM10007359_21600 [Rothia aerolata]
MKLIKNSAFVLMILIGIVAFFVRTPFFENNPEILWFNPIYTGLSFGIVAIGVFGLSRKKGK